MGREARLHRRNGYWHSKDMLGQFLPLNPLGRRFRFRSGRWLRSRNGLGVIGLVFRLGHRGDFGADGSGSHR